jgi:hypothetical protein
MKTILFLSGITLAVFGFMGIFTTKAAEPEGLVVAELFTSQSCSSCPPADRVLSEISQNPNVIALGYHVTYWDHLSWKDTLSLERATSLQREVNAALGSGRVYTPQMVVNGAADFVGSSRGAIISRLSQSEAITPIPVSIENGTLTARLDGVSSDLNGLTLMVVGFDDVHTQSIASGENSGKTVTYHNPVRYIDYPKNWQGTSGALTIPVSQPVQGGYAVILREGRGGTIRAAGQIKV